MLHEDPGNISYSAVGGLSDQIRELRESIELPLMNPELFLRVGIKPPKVVLLLLIIMYSIYVVKGLHCITLSSSTTGEGCIVLPCIYKFWLGST